MSSAPSDNYDSEGDSSIPSCFTACTPFRNCVTSSAGGLQNVLRHPVSRRLQQPKDNRDNIETLLASELNSLSLNERNRITEEIHGVADTLFDETHDCVEKKLLQLDNELEKLNANGALDAYNCAMLQDSNFVRNESFRLMFLRADEFDAEKAAQRMAKHFEYKKQLFGIEKIAKVITIADLSEGDQVMLRSGGKQCLGTVDVKGRSVIFIFPALFKYDTWECHHRAVWYLYTLALEQETAQRHGLVTVVIGSPSSPMLSVVDRMYMLFDGLPLRRLVNHFCLVGMSMNPILSLILQTLDRQFRLRSRFHVEETAIQCLYTLQSFGINPESVPMGFDGKPKLDKFFELLNARQELEQRIEQQNRIKALQTPSPDSLTDVQTVEVSSVPSRIPFLTSSGSSSRTTRRGNGVTSSGELRRITSTSSSSSTAISSISKLSIVPNDNDVLMQQGKKYRLHPGNVLLEQLIVENLPSFQQAPSAFDKTCVVLGIVQGIKEEGGRFLIRDKQNQEWVVARDPAVHDAVGSRCRTRSKATLAAKGRGKARTSKASQEQPFQQLN